MIDIKEYTQNGLPYTDIYLTRGDDATLVLPIYSVAADGTKTLYTLDNSDVVAVQVRATPITASSPTPAIIINGTVNDVDGTANWLIDNDDSTINCGTYYWDAQITTGGKIYTFYSGRFIILPEVTM